MSQRNRDRTDTVRERETYGEEHRERKRLRKRFRDKEQK